MPSITHNEKPAAATDHGGLKLVHTTARPARKDQTHAQYHDEHSQFKPHR